MTALRSHRGGKNFKDLTGQRFKHLTVLCRAPNRGRGRTAWWVCVCECGQTVVVDGGHLRTGHTQSCGCLHTAHASQINRRHGASRTQEYFVWKGMHARCRLPSNPQFKNYGARGITVCKRWDQFENFLADMGPRPGRGYSIERQDNNRGYGPDNCVWATAVVQGNNRRGNRLLTLRGVTKTLMVWSRELQMGRHAIERRLSRGWSVEDALSLPLRSKNRRVVPIAG